MYYVSYGYLGYLPFTYANGFTTLQSAKDDIREFFSDEWGKPTRGLYLRDIRKSDTLYTGCDVIVDNVYAHIVYENKPRLEEW